MKEKKRDKKTEKITVVVSKSQKKFLNDCVSFYYAEGAPISISLLVSQLVFDERNGLFKDLEYATGRAVR